MDTQTNYNYVLSDYTTSQCVDLIDQINFGFVLTEQTVIKRIWVDVRSNFSTGCSLTIKASASGAPTNILYSNSTFITGTSDISLPNTAAYKYFVVQAYDPLDLPCRICGIEMFSG
jgi:hypothetical protein